MLFLLILYLHPVVFSGQLFLSAWVFVSVQHMKTGLSHDCAIKGKDDIDFGDPETFS